jgi:restriction system protein
VQRLLRPLPRLHPGWLAGARSSSRLAQSIMGKGRSGLQSVITMGRSSGFVGLISAMAREAARAERAQIAEARREEREHAHRIRAGARYAKEAAKEARQRHLDACLAQAEEKTTRTVERREALAGLLEHTLSVDHTFSFAALKLPREFGAFAVPAELATAVDRPSEPVIPPATWFERNLPWFKRRNEARLAEARAEHLEVLSRAECAEAERVRRVRALRDEYDVSCVAHSARVGQRDQEVYELERSYRAGERDTVVAYNAMVLERSAYPEGFPQSFRLAYSEQSKELVIEYELPTVEVIPKVAECRYIRTRDELIEKLRKPADIAKDYSDVIASVVLRTLHEVFEADHGSVVDVAVFNGIVQTVNPATGRDTRPCIISLRVVKSEFNLLDLRRVEKENCLRNLGANVSSRPEQVVPVKPMVEFDMVDPRFIDQNDVLGGLDGRPNLMDLTPAEFEALVSNLFRRMGLETKLTRTSRDGGVDAVAFDLRPVVGGKVVIQAKRYRHTVGVSAVRDLYGTMMNEGANKGVLVATSGYGPDAFQFAKDKPIELINGGSLLYLLEQVGVQATIVFPPEQS